MRGLKHKVIYIIYWDKIIGHVYKIVEYYSKKYIIDILFKD